MDLLTYKEAEGLRLGIRTASGVLDIEAAAGKIAVGSGGAVPLTLQQLFDGGDAALASLQLLINQAEGDRTLLKEEAGLILGPCVPNPGKIICIGLNYRRHAEETNMPIPAYPILFNKFANALAAHGEEVPLPRSSDKIDYEAELAIVIGKTAKYVSKEEALDYVFGYCTANDLSARDLQTRTSQWLAGKSCDKFAPLGPYLVTKDEVENPNDLAISCKVNGELRQNSNTSDMIFNCEEIVSYISQCMTLEPGDVILTGTPEGVVLGYPPEDQVYLQHGDVVTIEIERLGALTNRMVTE
ncbi:fumarylacetoacetate hydrolase family protein [Paenibacillus gorillae]|uniref:fumarylacetoacetate hydrolase family protein n=1 Tax=Paenibacillus gorillae TaxID=1243662 RepID=UPI0004B9BA75|nr:fumarylacetoacetate hydrolase family protein [Paenibacillus gorillae]